MLIWTKPRLFLRQKSWNYPNLHQEMTKAEAHNKVNKVLKNGIIENINTFLQLSIESSWRTRNVITIEQNTTVHVGQQLLEESSTPNKIKPEKEENRIK